MRKSVLLLAVLLTAACVSNPPPGAVPGRISVVSDTRSPYWTSLIQQYVPRGLNDYADYDIVDGSASAPYVLRVRILNADSYVGNYAIQAPPSRGQAATVTPRYRTKIEIEAGFFDSSGSLVWSWSGWADYPSAEKSMKTIAKMLGKEMSKSGFLLPSYYGSTLR